MSAIITAQSAGIAATGARFAGRTSHVWDGDRLQPSGLHHRAGHHRDSGRRNQRERPVQRHDRCTSRSRSCLFVIGLGIHYINTDELGHRLEYLRAPRFCRESEREQPTYSSPTSDSMQSPPRRRKRRIRNGICPIGMIASLAICTVLYIAVAGVLTGMVHWQQINIEAPVARAFLDRGLTTASHIITLGALAGLTSVMLVMLLGQTRVLYSMANDGLLPKKVLRRHPPQVPHSVEEHDSGRTAGRDRRQRDSDRRHRQDGEHRNAAGFRDRVDCGHGAAPHESRVSRGHSARRGCRWFRSSV